MQNTARQNKLKHYLQQIMSANVAQETYLISYDMVKGGNYDELFQAIKKYGQWARITESLWAIKTEQTASEIRANLGQYFPDGSRIFVIRSGMESAWSNVICSNLWLKKHL
jgi:hypothetical protein